MNRFYSALDTRDGEINFLAEAEAAFATLKPKKETAQKKAETQTVTTAAKKKAAKKKKIAA